jgi:hypothetical protein
MEDEKRIAEAKKIIIDIFHKYENLSGFVISDEKYDEVRWLVSQAKQAYDFDWSKDI